MPLDIALRSPTASFEILLLSESTPLNVSGYGGTTIVVDVSSLLPGRYRAHLGPIGSNQDPTCSTVNLPHMTEFDVTATTGTVTLVTPPSSVVNVVLYLYFEAVDGGFSATAFQTYVALPRQALSGTASLRQVLLPQKLNVGKLRF